MSTTMSPRLGSRPQCLEGLPAFPAVARKLMDLVSREDCSIADVSRLIRTDASFTAEVMRLANSAMFGFRHEVVSILHAISVLGMDRLKGLVLTVGMRDFLAGARHMEMIRRCWRHNLACALTCEWLAQAWWLDKSVAYTAGLLHDLGRLALMMLHPTEYQNLAAMAQQTDMALAECEKRTFGIDSCEAGMWLAEDWRLPPALTDVICYHGKTIPNPDLGLPSLMSLSCLSADSMGFPVIGQAPPWDLEILRIAIPEHLRERVEPRVVELPSVVPFKINVFECEFLH